MNDAIAAEITLIHRKVDHLLLAVHFLLTRNPDMASADDIRAALTANSDKLIKAGAAADVLIASHATAVAAGSIDDGILTDIQGQGAAIDALAAKMAAAVPAAIAPAEAAPAAPEVAAPVAPVVSLAVPAA